MPEISGSLHVFVAFDWGEEIRLDQAARLVPAAPQELARRRRTPSSFSYRPSPLYLPLPALALDLPELGKVEASAALTLFDFAAVSLALQVPFKLAPEGLLRLAGSLADPADCLQKARGHLEGLHRQLLPAIGEPSWQDDMSEEYFVFQLPPGQVNLATDASWLAGLVHLETASLSQAEIAEALRLQISYSPDDVFIPDWAGAVLIDRDCDETLQAVAFANLQLLEFRNIDNRLDQSLASASRMIAPLTRSALPFWRSHARPMRALGELKVEAMALFERTGNALKLVGDPYLARVYRLLATRFHLETWEENIKGKLDVAESVYQVVTDQAGQFRAEFLEVVVVILILIEIILAFRH